MIKSIVAAVDGSAESISGLELAAKWAVRLDAVVRGVFVEKQSRFTTVPSYSESEGAIPKPVPLPADKLKEVEAAVKAEEAQLQARFQEVQKAHGFKGEMYFYRGRASDILVREARAAGLIVVGKKGVDDAPNVRQVGPIAETVLHESLRPVLVAPGGKDNGAGGILIAYDGSAGVERVLPVGVEMAFAQQLAVTVLTVKSEMAEGQKIQEPVRSYVKPFGLSTDFRIDLGKKGAAQAILETANEIDAAMIVMGAFTLTPLKEFFLGSVTRDVLAGTACPVLMMT